MLHSVASVHKRLLACVGFEHIEHDSSHLVEHGGVGLVAMTSHGTDDTLEQHNVFDFGNVGHENLFLSQIKSTPAASKDAKVWPDGKE